MNEPIKIRYKQRHRYLHIAMGFLWSCFFAVKIFYRDSSDWFDYIFLLISILYVSLYLFQTWFGYATIENGILSVYDFPIKRIDLREVTQFRYYAGDYILESESKKLRINTHLLDPQDVLQLKTKLSEYGLQPGTNRKVQVES